jgi:hypothetical protein
MKHAWLWLCVVSPVVVAGAQNAPALDRTDPAAVAQAYVQACREGDLETALALLEPDERLRHEVRDFARSFTDEGGPGEKGLTAGDFMLELQFVPLSFPIDRTFVAAKTEGNESHVTFHANWPYDQEVVLARQEDGTWAVKFLDSIKATNKRDVSWIEDEMDLEPAPEGPPQQPPPGSPLERLAQAAMEYAGDHEGLLPPADRWVDELELYVLDRALLKNPDAPNLEYGYAMNREVGGQNIADLFGEVAADRLLFIENHTGERNAVTTPDGVAQIRSVREDLSINYITVQGVSDSLRQGQTYDQAREAARAALQQEEGPDVDWEHYSTCTSHLRTLVQAIRRYARQHGGLLPEAATWQDDIALVLLDMGDQGDMGQAQDPADLFRCPAAPDLNFAYALNEEIAGRNALELTGHDSIILLFESDLNRPNAAGSPERDMARNRHRFPGHAAPLFALVGYLGGSVGELEAAPAP